VSTIESRAKLVQAAKKLMADWQQAQEAWRDENCRQFDKKYMAPLESSIRAAALAMERMEAMLDGARQDCGDTTGRIYERASASLSARPEPSNAGDHTGLYRRAMNEVLRLSAAQVQPLESQIETDYRITKQRAQSGLTPTRAESKPTSGPEPGASTPA